MTPLRAWFLRLAGLFHRERRDQEFAAELESHLAMHIEENLRAGMSPEEARREARIKLGGIEAVKEEYRDRRGVPFLEGFGHDLRFGLRALRKNPGFTAVVILTLALGLGANTAIFSIMDAVLLRSLPVRNSQELVVIGTRDARSGMNTDFSYPRYQDLRDKSTVFAGVLAKAGAEMNVSYAGQNERVRGQLVSGNYFEVLGVQPWIGRLFTQNDDLKPGAHPVAVLSYGFWHRRFGDDASMVGKEILLNDHAITVVGVTPPGFYGTDLSEGADIRVPMMMATVFRPVPANRLQNRRHSWLEIMARRKPGVTLAQAQASLEVLHLQIIEGEAAQLPPTVSAFNKQRFLESRIRLMPGSQGFGFLQRELEQPLLLVFGVTGVVLLILCANLANLLLARTAARGSEIAVRLTLGAGRLRLLRQWLTESLLLSTLGALAGMVVAVWVRTAVMGFLPADYSSNLDTSLGWRVFGFMLLVSMMTGMLLGLAPAVRASRQQVGPTLQGGARTFASGGGLFSLRGGLIVLQIALSLPLLIGAGLFLHSLQNLRNIATGFDKENVLLATLNPSLNGYSQEKIQNLYGDLLDRIRALPGIRAAALASASPVSGGWDSETVTVEGYAPRQGEEMNPNAAIVSTDYFKTMAIPVIAGREFTAHDTPAAPKVAVINETMAHYFFGDTNPIGKKIGTNDAPGSLPDIEIVGVVKDAKYVKLREQPLRHFYLPIGQQPRLFELTLHVRAEGDPRPLVDVVRAQLQKLDPHLPLYDVKLLDTQIDESLTQDRLITWLSSLFGLLATLLAAVGLYGVVAFSVARRTREIGIRMALGALPGDILRAVLGEMGILVATGVVLGLAAALAVGGLLRGMLYGVRPVDPLAFAAAGAVLVSAAAVAAYFPAKRATRVDPIIALRYE
jgi:predicted permease